MHKARIQRENFQHTGDLQPNDNIGKIYPIYQKDKKVDQSALVKLGLGVVTLIVGLLSWIYKRTTISRIDALASENKEQAKEIGQLKEEMAEMRGERKAVMQMIKGGKDVG